jgi:hypothetical protein
MDACPDWITKWAHLVGDLSRALGVPEAGLAQHGWAALRASGDSHIRPPPTAVLAQKMVPDLSAMLWIVTCTHFFSLQIDHKQNLNVYAYNCSAWELTSFWRR